MVRALGKWLTAEDAEAVEVPQAITDALVTLWVDGSREIEKDLVVLGGLEKRLAEKAVTVERELAVVVLTALVEKRQAVVVVAVKKLQIVGGDRVKKWV